MRKPEIEIVKFDSSDVIATSGKVYKLNVDHYKDGQANNLIVNFDGNNYNSYDSLNSALGSAGLRYSRTDTTASSGNDGKDLKWYFDYDLKLDATGNQGVLNYGVNGDYTWFADEERWHHD